MAAIGVLTLSLHIQHAQSLKDKRQVLRALKDRLRRQHNISIAEIDFFDTWQRSEIGIVTISVSRERVQEVLNRAERDAVRLLGNDLAASYTEFL